MNRERSLERSIVPSATTLVPILAVQLTLIQPAAATPTQFIHEVQVSGSAVAIIGPVVVQGIVTALFVYRGSYCPAGNATRDRVTVSGDASEVFGMSQIRTDSGTNVAVINSSGNPIPSSIAVDLRAAGSTLDALTFEQSEGMFVTFPDKLVLSEHFQLSRFGQLVLTETWRPPQFTDIKVPGVASYAAFQEQLARRRHYN